MAYRFNLNGIPVECDSLAELREAVGAFAGQIANVDTPTMTPSRPPTTAVARRQGAGPSKSWAMARWYAAREQIEPDAARSKIAEIKRTKFNEYQALEQEFFASQSKD